MNGPQNPAEANDENPDGMTQHQAYNVVSDTVTGANLRWRDNVFQAIAIAVCLVLGSIIGALVVEARIPGAVMGAFAGLLAGLLGSGIFLMVFRALMHLRGRHD